MKVVNYVHIYVYMLINDLKLSKLIVYLYEKKN